MDRRFVHRQFEAAAQSIGLQKFRRNFWYLPSVEFVVLAFEMGTEYRSRGVELQPCLYILDKVMTEEFDRARLSAVGGEKPLYPGAPRDMAFMAAIGNPRFAFTEEAASEIILKAGEKLNEICRNTLANVKDARSLLEALRELRLLSGAYGGIFLLFLESKFMTGEEFRNRLVIAKTPAERQMFEFLVKDMASQ